MKNKDWILYSTNCPKCKLLKRLLDEHHISYSINTDVGYMIERGFLYVPVLENTDSGEFMNFEESVTMINGGMK